MAAIEAAHRAPLRRCRGSAAGQRPFRRAGVDARDDGHDPQPRHRRPRPTGAFAAAGPFARLPRRCSARPSAPSVPDDPWAQLRQAIEAVFRSWNSDRARAYRAKEGIPDDLGTGVDGPGDGLRQPGPGFRDRRAVHAQSGNRRARAVRRRHVRRAGRGRRRRNARDRTDLRARRANAGRRGGAARPTPTGSSATTPTCATSSSRSRTAACGCSRCASASAVRRRRCGSRSTWPRTPDFPLSASRGGASVSCRCSRTRHVRATSRSSILRPLVTGLPASPGTASGEIAHDPEAAIEAADAGRAGHPGPGRDVARRRPRHGQGGRHPDRDGRSRQPCRRRSPRLGHPGGGRSVGGAGRRSLRSRSATGRSGPATTITIDGGSGEVFEGAIAGTTEAVPEAATLLGWAARARDRGAATRPCPNPRARPRARASSTRCIHALGIKGFAMTQGVADAVLSIARARPAVARRPGRRRARGVGCRGIPAHRQRQGPRRRARRGGSRGMGRRARECRTRRLPRARPADEGGRDGLAAQGGRTSSTTTPTPEYDRDVLDRLAALHRDAAAFLDGHDERVRQPCDLQGAARPARSTRRSAGTAASWPHRGWTRITASGSSSTRT